MTQRDPMMAMLSSLVAAVSVLEEASEKKCDPKKVVMSDAAFRLMIRDYKTAIRNGREALTAKRAGEI